MAYKKILLIVCLVHISGWVSSQTFQDIVAVDVKKSGSSFSIIKGTEIRITDRKAYDNQPNFINEAQMAFSAADEKGNHDIIIYNFNSGKFTNLSKTAEFSEYSPRITDCGMYISAVRVEEDGKQRLWLYPTNFGEPELLYDDIEPVGYYDWYNNKAALFKLGESNTLIYPYSKGEILTISQNIGRSIQKKPKTSIITFIDLNDSKEVDGQKVFAIKGFDIEKRLMLSFGYTIPGSEDFIWLDKNLLLMGEGNSLFLRKSNQENWEKVGSVSFQGLAGISRMAFSDKLKKLVMVMERE